MQHRGDGTWWDEDAGLWRDGGGKPLRKFAAPIGSDAATLFTPYELPRNDAWLRVVESRDATCRDVPEDAF